MSHSSALRIKNTGTQEAGDFASPTSFSPIRNSEAEFCCCVLDTFQTVAQMLAAYQLHHQSPILHDEA